VKATTTTRPEAPSFTTLLNEALEKPGSIMKAYSVFHNYSLGNQLLALIQCYARGLSPSPINTFPGWKNLGRSVKKGEKALMLCMPVTFKRRDNNNPGELDADEGFTTGFIYRSRWFALSQTEGPEIELPPLPNWDPTLALQNLNIVQVPFTKPDGNCQGYARKREIAINPIAQLPQKTFFHEAAHVIIGHTEENDFKDGKHTPKNLREVEAESVAYLCCEALGLEGSEFCRGYIQNWANGEPIPEQSAKRILGAADKILKAGSTNKPPTYH
jgi:antirestriction protein ArdC